MNTQNIESEIMESVGKLSTTTDSRKLQYLLQQMVGPLDRYYKGDEKMSSDERVQYHRQYESVLHEIAPKHIDEIISAIDRAQIESGEAENAQTSNIHLYLGKAGVASNPRVRESLWNHAKRNPDGTLDSYFLENAVRYVLNTDGGFAELIALPGVKNALIGDTSEEGGVRGVCSMITCPVWKIILDPERALGFARQLGRGPVEEITKCLEPTKLEYSKKIMSLLEKYMKA